MLRRGRSLAEAVGLSLTVRRDRTSMYVFESVHPRYTTKGDSGQREELVLLVVVGTKLGQEKMDDAKQSGRGARNSFRRAEEQRDKQSRGVGGLV